ncbi:hypothetical protein YC2023_044421 [Brassica napus]
MDGVDGGFICMELELYLNSLTNNPTFYVAYLKLCSLDFAFAYVRGGHKSNNYVFGVLFAAKGSLNKRFDMYVSRLLRPLDQCRAKVFGGPRRRWNVKKIDIRFISKLIASPLDGKLISKIGNGEKCGYFLGGDNLKIEYLLKVSTSRFEVQIPDYGIYCRLHRKFRFQFPEQTIYSTIMRLLKKGLQEFLNMMQVNPIRRDLHRTAQMMQLGVDPHKAGSIVGYRIVFIMHIKPFNMKIDKELLNEHLLAFSSVSPSNSSNSLEYYSLVKETQYYIQLGESTKHDD